MAPCDGNVGGFTSLSSTCGLPFSFVTGTRTLPRGPTGIGAIAEVRSSVGNTMLLSESKGGSTLMDDCNIIPVECTLIPNPHFVWSTSKRSSTVSSTSSRTIGSFGIGSTHFFSSFTNTSTCPLRSPETEVTPIFSSFIPSITSSFTCIFSFMEGSDVSLSSGSSIGGGGKGGGGGGG